MRKFIMFFAITCSMACNTQQTKEGEAAEDTKMAASADITYPYPISYSSNFELGDPKNAQMILNMWKDFDKNQLDQAGKYFADSVVMEFPNERMAGPRDSIVSQTKAYRNMLKSVESRIAAVISVKETNTNDNWVLVWGTEVVTDNKNVTDSSHLQETWRLNKEGKVDFMMQYRRKALPAM